MKNFVQLLSVQPKDSPKRIVTHRPQWADVELALSGLENGDIRFFELSDSVDEASVMTVYGETGVCHISIITNETEQSWLVFGPENEVRVEIGGSIFPKHQVCYDRDLAHRIVRCFFDSGVRSTEAKWFTDIIEE